MDGKDIVKKFAAETAEAVAITVERTPKIEDIVPAATEVAEAVLARYKRTNPELFDGKMTIFVKNFCMCGQCRELIAIGMADELEELFAWAVQK